MAEQTLLDMTQNILSALDSDEVNSIGDTTEALQVAKIIRNKYYDIVSRDSLPAQETLLTLDPSNDSFKPTLMYVPAGVSRIDWIKYFNVNPSDDQQSDQFGAYSHGVNLDLVNSTPWVTTSTSSITIGLGAKIFTVASNTLTAVPGQKVLVESGTNQMRGIVVSYTGFTLIVSVTQISGSGTYTSWNISQDTQDGIPGYQYVKMLSINDFLDMINRLDPTSPQVGSYVFTEGGSSFTLYYKNNFQPRYCTVIENNYILFDSYDNLYDDTLQASKVMAYGIRVSPFLLEDTFIPDIDDNQFALLLNEAKALAFYELKQMPHAKAEQEIKRQWSAAQKNKAVSNKPTSFDQLANFGRMPRTGGYGGYGVYRWMRQANP